MAPPNSLTPVHVFSHGSTMILGRESALANGIEHVVMMVGNFQSMPSIFRINITDTHHKEGAHWATPGDEIEVAANPIPAKFPVAYVEPTKFVPYKLNPDLPIASRYVETLKKNDLKAKLNNKFDRIHDTYLILIRCFQMIVRPRQLSV